MVTCRLTLILLLYRTSYCRICIHLCKYYTLPHALDYIGIFLLSWKYLISCMALCSICYRCLLFYWIWHRLCYCCKFIYLLRTAMCIGSILQCVIVFDHYFVIHLALVWYLFYIFPFVIFINDLLLVFLYVLPIG